VLAETNLDGNCFILMVLTLMFAFLTSTDLSWYSYIALAALVLFLSYGAPNQPGSILIGTLIITMYLNSFEVVCLAIFSEAFLGSAQNLINVIGDIVLVAIEDSKEKARAEGA
jgi:Na+/H+-dicarboxylate symporter